MNLSRIKKALVKAGVSELQELERWCRTRAGVVRAREHDQRVDRAWLSVATSKPGDVLFAHTKSDALLTVWNYKSNGSVHRPLRQKRELFGYPLRVWKVQHRAQRIWLDIRGEVISLSKEEVLFRGISPIVPVGAVTQAILGDNKEVDDDLPF